MHWHSMMLVGAIVLVGIGATDRTEVEATTPVQPLAVAAAANSPAPPIASAGPAHAEAIRSALTALSEHVVRQSNANALRSAVTAYYNFKAENPDEVKKPYLYYVDYGLSNSTPRGYVFNMETLELIQGPFIVAHGRGSGPKNAVPKRFSNRHGSAATSLGLYVTQETYGFSGKAGGRHYTSVGLRMSGESGRFNSNARGRGVVVHGAPYVTPSAAGRSEGCPAMEQRRARKLLPMLAHGSVVFQYSPHDADWLQNDPWVNAE
ncbi:MAG TPA: murein L,D-transpeptidase catalytic domain family protein [Longimicrobiales bacterium]|nr:murein L,D-transpeptidase catalytic domain family protein [Longimicrobiales bacterium]